MNDLQIRFYTLQLETINKNNVDVKLLCTYSTSVQNGSALVRLLSFPCGHSYQYITNDVIVATSIMQIMIILQKNIGCVYRKRALSLEIYSTFIFKVLEMRSS